MKASFDVNILTTESLTYSFDVAGKSTSPLTALLETHNCSDKVQKITTCIL